MSDIILIILNKVKEWVMSNTVWTIIAGVLGFVLSELYNVYRLKPIKNYIELREKISSSLTLYANLYMNPVEFNLANESAERNQASVELRKLAAEIDAMAKLRPTFSMLIAKKDILSKVSSNLIGLSNELYSPHPDYAREHNEKRRNEIYNLLGIKKYQEE